MPSGSGQNKNASPLRKFRGETVTSHGSTLLTALAVARVLCNGRARSGLLPRGGSADCSGVVSPPCRAGYSQPRYPSLPAAPQFCLHQRFSVGYYSTKMSPCQALQAWSPLRNREKARGSSGSFLILAIGKKNMYCIVKGRVFQTCSGMATTRCADVQWTI